MSTTIFKAGYVVNVSDLTYNEILQKLGECGVPIKEVSYSGPDDYSFELEAPWNFHTSEGRSAIQIVVVEEETSGEHAVAFSQDMAQRLLQGLHAEYPQFFNFLFRDGHCGLYPVAYAYNSDNEEPVIV